MKQGFRQSMAWLHGWSGLLVGWVLFAVFLTGTAAYLRPEISSWMRPEIGLSTPGPRDAEVALAAMQGLAPGSSAWFITLPDGRDGVTRVYWRDPQGGGRRFREAALDPATGRPVTARDTTGGEFFYRFHFQLHYMSVLWGRWIVTICTMAMLVAIVSGVITHRRIFADFFTFRPRKGQRSWLDAHNVSAVLALPYHLMITYTGLVIFMLMAMPWGVQQAYPDDRAAFNAALSGNAPPRRPAGVAVPLVPVEPLLRQATARWGGGTVGRIAVTHPGDANATIQLTRLDSERLSSSAQSMTFDGGTGALLAASHPGGPAAETRGVLYGLHIGRFAGPLLRALFVLAGLAGTAMVATGCVLWAARQRQQAERHGDIGLGTRLVEHLNVATIAGMPLAMAAFFLANRLLPLELPGRADWEIHVFFLTWGACLLHPLLRRGRAAWVDQFAAGALAFALLPLLDALLTQHHLWAALMAGDRVRAGFALGLLATAALLALAAWRVHRHRPGTAARARAAPPRRVEAVP